MFHVTFFCFPCELLCCSFSLSFLLFSSLHFKDIIIAGKSWTDALEVMRHSGVIVPLCDVTLMFSLLECVLWWVTLFVRSCEMTVHYYSKSTWQWESRMRPFRVWVAVKLFTFSLIVCLLMLSVDECLIGWNLWCSVHPTTDWRPKAPVIK